MVLTVVLYARLVTTCYVLQVQQEGSPSRHELGDQDEHVGRPVGGCATGPCAGRDPLRPQHLRCLPSLVRSSDTYQARTWCRRARTTCPGTDRHVPRAFRAGRPSRGTLYPTSKTSLVVSAIIVLTLSCFRCRRASLLRLRRTSAPGCRGCRTVWRAHATRRSRLSVVWLLKPHEFLACCRAPGSRRWIRSGLADSLYVRRRRPVRQRHCRRQGPSDPVRHRRALTRPDARPDPARQGLRRPERPPGHSLVHRQRRTTSVLHTPSPSTRSTRSTPRVRTTCHTSIWSPSRAPWG